jgi:dTDP-4-amino-4,6-dideoxygalactose transaminase
LELSDALTARVANVIRSGQMLQGPDVAAFEQSLSRRCDRQHAVCVGSGTDALYFALIALGIGVGDEVLAPDVSFVATAAAIRRAGATPVLVDIDEICNLDIAKAADKITSRTRAMVYVQLFGGMGDTARLEAFAAQFGLAIVEDAAQSFGARLGRPAGGVGQVSALSFDPMKVLSAPGSGGAVLTDDVEIAARIRRLRYHGRQDGLYLEVGFNSQMSSLVAATLALKLEHHDCWTTRRQQIAGRFLDAFGDLPLWFPTWSDNLRHVWHKFTMRYEKRDDLAAWLRAEGVPTMVHYPRPFHREPFLDCLADDALFPTASRHAATTLSLPIHAHLEDGEVEQIVDAVRGYFRQAA